MSGQSISEKKRQAFLHQQSHIKFHNLKDNKEEYVHVSKTKLSRLKNKKLISTAVSERNGAGLAKIH